MIPRPTLMPESPAPPSQSGKATLVATCALGTEPALKQELHALRVNKVKGSRGSVAFEGTLQDAMRACLELRSAMRVLWPLHTFPAENADALYEGTRSIPWADHLTPKHTFAVEATGATPELRHTGFVALKVKDAICDTMREAAGARPDVDARHPNVPVLVHLHDGNATVSLDLAGPALHRRGYRPEGAQAPLKETLAAALLLMAGYDGKVPFVDPMAGSGTLAVEAAWMAMQRAPGLDRHFAFERWPTFAGEMQGHWHRLLHAARARVKTQDVPMVLARDWLDTPMEHLMESVTRAGVDAVVRVERGDVRKLRLPVGPGMVLSNPPYAERMGKDLQILGLYRSLGQVAQTWEGWTVAFFCAHPRFEREVGLPVERRWTLHNGALKTELFRYAPMPAAAEDGAAMPPEEDPQ